MKLSLAPLQGLTEAPFRIALHEIAGGIDAFYTPFLRLENDKTLKSKYRKDILPEINKGIPLIPQILTGNATDFLFMAKLIEELGYDEINWNLGCPYPMVTNRKMGSGLIPFPETVVEILEAVLPKMKAQISIKIRSGLIQHDEIFTLLPILEKYPLKEIILHPRIGKQLYKGEAKLENFIHAQNKTKLKLAYNGDITTLDGFYELRGKLPDTTHFMIGRGLISNPFLAYEIKNKHKITEKEKREKLANIHETLLHYYALNLSGETHILQKILTFWNYFSLQFENPKKIWKHLKKSKNLNTFKANIQTIIQTEAFIK